GHNLDFFSNAIPITTPKLTPAAAVMGSCLWINTALWNYIGGFPEWFGSMAEDLFVCSAARLSGKKAYCVNHSGYDHHVGFSFGGGKAVNGTLKLSIKRRHLSERNKLFVIYMCYPGATSFITLLIAIPCLIAEGLVIAASHRNVHILIDIYIDAIKSLFLNRLLLKAERKKLQAKKHVSVREFFQGYKIIPRKISLLLRHGIPRK
ncbi:MAG: hypothetical protein QM709_00005, partial [Spongiibacteraceae bacterium]